MPFQTANRVIRPREAEAITRYSNMHLSRLEKRGMFPRRFKLSPAGGKSGAVGWLESDISDWLAERAASRGSAR